jgi:hypothetical protein
MGGKLSVSQPGVKSMTSKGLKRKYTFLARWALLSSEEPKIRVI